MPRANPPKPITVLLPSASASYAPYPPSGSASGSGTSKGKGKKEMIPATSLEVLILAKEIAQEKGQHFDIWSFLSPEQKVEYHKILYGQDAPAGKYGQRPPTPVSAPPPTNEVGGEERLGEPSSSDGKGPNGHAVLEPTLSENPTTIVGEGVNGTATPNPLESTTVPAGPSTLSNGVANSVPATETEPPQEAPSRSNGFTETPDERRARLTNSNLHWTQKRKKLQELAKLEAEGVTEIPISPIDREPPMSQDHPIHAINAASKVKGEVDKASVQKSASYWNSLLIQARKERGPQWDYNTQSYQLDRTTKEYYTHMSKPLTTQPVAGPSNPASAANGIPPIGAVKAEQSSAAGLSSAPLPGRSSRNGSISAPYLPGPSFGGIGNQSLVYANSLGHVPQLGNTIHHSQPSSAQHTPSNSVSMPPRPSQSPHQFQQVNYTPTRQGYPSLPPQSPQNASPHHASPHPSLPGPSPSPHQQYATPQKFSTSLDPVNGTSKNIRVSPAQLAQVAQYGAASGGSVNPALLQLQMAQNALAQQNHSPSQNQQRNPSFGGMGSQPGQQNLQGQLAQLTQFAANQSAQSGQGQTNLAGATTQTSNAYDPAPNFLQSISPAMFAHMAQRVQQAQQTGQAGQTGQSGQGAQPGPQGSAGAANTIPSGGVNLAALGGINPSQMHLGNMVQRQGMSVGVNGPGSTTPGTGSFGSGRQ